MDFGELLELSLKIGADEAYKIYEKMEDEEKSHKIEKQQDECTTYDEFDWDLYYINHPEEDLEDCYNPGWGYIFDNRNLDHLVGYDSFNDHQKYVIDGGLKAGIDVSMYADTKYNFKQMFELYLGLYNGIDVSMYADTKYDHFQMAAIREGLEAGIDVSVYADTKYNWMQMRLLLKALKYGKDTSSFASPKFNFEQMEEIYLGICHDIDVSMYADTKYNSMQMNKIRYELEESYNT